MPKQKTDPKHMYPLRDAIRRRINEFGITQSEAARRVDVEVRLLNYWQNSLRSMPGPEQWRALVVGLGLDGEELLRELGYVNPTPHRVYRRSIFD